MFLTSLFTPVGRNQDFHSPTTQPYPLCSLVSGSASFCSCSSFSFYFSSPSHYDFPSYQKAVTSMGTTTKRELSEHDVLILNGACTPFGCSLVGTLALPAPAEISLKSMGPSGAGPVQHVYKMCSH